MIDNTKAAELLSTPIRELPFSADFKFVAGQMSFTTLGEIVDTKEREILSHPKFKHEWLTELVRFMRQHGLVHLLEAPSRF